MVILHIYKWFYAFVFSNNLFNISYFKILQGNVYNSA